MSRDAPSNDELLRIVARSFQLTLRLVPRRRRETLSRAYLIARAADAACDLPGVDRAWRVAQLEALRARLDGSPAPPLSAPPTAWDPAHRTLFERLPTWLADGEALPPAHRPPTRRVLGELVDGMLAELRREPGSRPRTDREVLAHAHRAAGCVGRYWTELLCSERPPRSPRERQRLTRLGIRLGIGLQLVNLVRDEHEDAARGRPHFPKPLADREVFDAWLCRARAFLASGIEYADRLPRLSWRDRLAVLLPTTLGARTVALLAERFEEHRAGQRLKVERAALVRLVRSLTWRLPWPRVASRLARSGLTYHTVDRNLS